MGSLAEEALKLWQALREQQSAGSVPGDAAPHEAAHCPHGWCPACRVADFVADHPEVVDRVTDAVIDLARALGDAAESAKRQWGTR